MGKKTAEEVVETVVENQDIPVVAENGLKEITQTPGHNTRAFRQ